MLVPAFIQRMLGFAEKVEKSIDTAATSLAEALAKVAGLEAKVKTFEADIAAKDKMISESTASIADLNGKMAAKDKEIADLKAAAKTAGEQAVDIVAAAGLPADQLPAAKPGDAAAAVAGKTPSLREQYLALQRTD